MEKCEKADDWIIEGRKHNYVKKEKTGKLKIQKRENKQRKKGSCSAGATTGRTDLGCECGRP